MQTIINKTRDLIQDNYIIERNEFEYLSIVSSKVFTLSNDKINSSTIAVYLNGILKTLNIDYTYNSTNCSITYIGTIVAGDVLLITYNAYQKYSDTEIQGWIKAAISYLAVEKYGTFSVKSDNIIFPSPTEAEENLLAVIASILIRGDIIQYRTPELTMNFERGDSKETKIKKYIRQFKKTYGCLKYIDLGQEVVYDEDC